MSLEIEARFSSAQGELMLIAWFEGDSVARLVMTSPAGLREEVQINSIEASLGDDVKQVLGESFAPGEGNGLVTARLQLATERARVGRAVKLGNKHSKADSLCKKLVKMAELMSKDAEIKQSLGALRRQLRA
ncbi:MAG: hypothetical protein JNK82_20475 [Myxococcaceae bacterium]|nr:hypothetical protein [Myxococcaceae bacterium]